MVAGMMAGVPHHGGATWAVLQYLLGLRALGHDVVLVEPVERITPESIAYATEVMDKVGLSDRWALLANGTTETAGLGHAALRRIAARADILLNISGQLTDADLFAPVPVRAYVDLDPA